VDKLTQCLILVIQEVTAEKNKEDICGVEIRALIPQATTVLMALEKNPEECTEEEQTAVEFFYRKALVCVEANIASKDVWTAGNTYWKILLADWCFVFATGLTLLARYSCVGNIVENMQKKESSESDSSKDCKRKRARLHTKVEKAAVRYLYFSYCSLFRTMQKEEGAERRMERWDGLYSPAIRQASKKGAKDRQSIAPTEHQAKTESQSALNDFMLSSVDFSFLQPTGIDLWGQATNGLQDDRRMAINNEQGHEM
jgi:hypothetical protein